MRPIQISPYICGRNSNLRIMRKSDSSPGSSFCRSRSLLLSNSGQVPPLPISSICSIETGVPRKRSIANIGNTSNFGLHRTYHIMSCEMDRINGTLSGLAHNKFELERNEFFNISPFTKPPMLQNNSCSHLSVKNNEGPRLFSTLASKSDLPSPTNETSNELIGEDKYSSTQPSNSNLWQTSNSHRSQHPRRDKHQTRNNPIETIGNTHRLLKMAHTTTLEKVLDEAKSDPKFTSFLNFLRHCKVEKPERENEAKAAGLMNAVETTGSADTEVSAGSTDAIKSVDEADPLEGVLILPPRLLTGIHESIKHFSSERNFDGIVFSVPNAQGGTGKISGNIHGASFSEAGIRKHDDENEILDNHPPNLPNSQTMQHGQSQKIHGPMICAKLLEFIGILNSHGNLHYDSSSSDRSSLTIHSSQIDRILECCLFTTTALSRSCEPGKLSLVSTDTERTAAHMAEDIWRSVWNMKIKYTSGKGIDGQDNMMDRESDQTRRLGKGVNPIKEYLVGDADEVIDSNVVHPVANNGALMWSNKDKRRYDIGVMIFNAALNSYANLGSSSLGFPFEVRRDRVQKAEAILLEVANRSRGSTFLVSPVSTSDPSSSNILQLLQPDVISFNTVIKAWSELSSRNPRSPQTQESSMATSVAERSEAILELMKDLYDKDRSQKSTHEAVQISWEMNASDAKECGYLSQTIIAPNTSSFNSVLNAWSRSTDPDAPHRAWRVFESMVHRCNSSCFARDRLMAEFTPFRPTRQWRTDNKRNKRKEDQSSKITYCYPNGQTFMALLKACRSLSSTMSFSERMDFVERIYAAANDWEDQMAWSRDHGLIEKRDRSLGVGSHSILNSIVYNTLLSALSRLPEGNSWEEYHTVCLRIDDLIEKVTIESGDLLNIPLDSVSYALAIAAWRKCADSAQADNEKMQICADKVEPHTNTLISMLGYQSTPPNDYASNAICNAISIYKDAMLPSQADELFFRAKAYNLYNPRILSIVVEALTQNSNSSQGLDNVKRANQYLMNFEEQIEQNRVTTRSGVVYTQMYNAVLSGFANVPEKEEGAKRAHALLNHMIDSHESNKLHVARPNNYSFTRTMSALAQDGDRISELEQLLAKMEELAERKKGIPKESPDYEFASNAAPNKAVYNIILKAYARSTRNNDHESAIKLMERMEQNPEIGEIDGDTRYIIASMKNVTSLEDSDTKNVSISLREASESIQELSIETVDAVMDEYAKSRTIEGALQATDFLQQLEEMHRTGKNDYKPDIFLYNKVIDIWSECAKSNNNPSVCPASKAEELLKEVFSRGVSPTNSTFSKCILAWSKSSRPDAAKRAEQILRQKEKVAKNDTNINVKASDYNMVISRWKEDPKGGADHAIELFDELIQLFSRDKRMAPTAVTFNTILDVFAKSEDKKHSAEKACRLLATMNMWYDEEIIKFAPDQISYRCCIDALIREKQTDMPQQVESLVNEMIEKSKQEERKDLKPNTILFNLVLKACSQAPLDWVGEKLLRKNNDTRIAIANRIFGILSRTNEFNAAPTHLTYSYMFRVYKRHMDFNDKRYFPLMMGLWKHCCENGQVSRFTLEAFRQSILDSQFLEVLGDHVRGKKWNTTADDITINDLPYEWRRNVAPDRKGSDHDA